MGLKLKQALKRCERKVLDVDVELVFTRDGTRHTRVMRAVGLWNEEKGRYHVYLTNLDRELKLLLRTALEAVLPSAQ